jgi:hypothetical protein
LVVNAYSEMLQNIGHHPTILYMAELNALAVHWEMVWVSHHQSGLGCSLDRCMVLDGRWGDGGEGH